MARQRRRIERRVVLGRRRDAALVVDSCNEPQRATNKVHKNLLPSQ